MRGAPVTDTRTSQARGRAGDDLEPAVDWASLYPADPEIMVSVEGDKRGLAEVRRKAQQRIDRARSES